MDGEVVVVEGLVVVVATGGSDGVLITVGTGRDLSRRCASKRCARILLILSEREAWTVAVDDGSVLEGVGTTRGAGVGTTRGV